MEKGGGKGREGRRGGGGARMRGTREGEGRGRGGGGGGAAEEGRRTDAAATEATPAAGASCARRRGRACGRASLGRVLDDLREAHHGHRVVHRHLAAVDLLEEVDHLVDAPELGVVVLDLPRREVAHPLDLDLVDHRVEDLLPRRVLIADRHQHALVLAVLVGLVAEPDRGRLAAAPELVGEHRRVEVEDAHGSGSLPVRVPSATSRAAPSPARPGR